MLPTKPNLLPILHQLVEVETKSSWNLSNHPNGKKDLQKLDQLPIESIPKKLESLLDFYHH